MKNVRLGVVDWFAHLGSCVSSDGSISLEVNPHISKARVPYFNLFRLWCRSDVSLPTKGCAYNGTVCFVLYTSVKRS